jgi:hypothetical protein
MAFPEIVQQRASGEDFLGTMPWDNSIEREWAVEKPFQRLGKCWCKKVTGTQPKSERLDDVEILLIF